MHNVHNVPIYGEDGQTPAREFRVSPLNRYKVTDWERFNGGSVSTVAENLTLAQANRIATELGLAHPGSLVNTMEPPHEGSYVMVTKPAQMDVAIQLSEDGQLPAAVALRTLPYGWAAAIKQAAIVAGSDAVLALFDEARVAVDVYAPPRRVLTVPEMSSAELAKFKRHWADSRASTLMPVADLDAVTFADPASQREEVVTMTFLHSQYERLMVALQPLGGIDAVLYPPSVVTAP